MEPGPSPQVQRASEQLGFAAYVIARSKRYASLPVVALRVWVEPAVLLEQIRFCFDERGEVIGYFVWAHLAQDIEANIRDQDLPILHLSEWREGRNLWIIDAVAVEGKGRELLSFVRKTLAGWAHSTTYIRRDGQGRKRGVNTVYREGARLRIKRQQGEI